MRIRNKKPELVLLKQFLAFLKAKNQSLDQVNALVELGVILQTESKEKIESFCVHSLPYSISQFIWDISSAKDSNIVDYKFTINPDFNWADGNTKKSLPSSTRDISDCLIRAIFFINQVQIRNDLIKHHLDINWSLTNQAPTSSDSNTTNEMLSHLTKAINNLSESMSNFTPQHITISDQKEKESAHAPAEKEKKEEHSYNLDSLNPGSLL